MYAKLKDTSFIHFNSLFVLSPAHFGVSYTASSETRCFQLRINTSCHDCLLNIYQLHALILQCDESWQHVFIASWEHRVLDSGLYDTPKRVGLSTDKKSSVFLPKQFIFLPRCCLLDFAARGGPKLGPTHSNVTPLKWSVLPDAHSISRPSAEPWTHWTTGKLWAVATFSKENRTGVS